MELTAATVQQDSARQTRWERSSPMSGQAPPVAPVLPASVDPVAEAEVPGADPKPRSLPTPTSWAPLVVEVAQEVAGEAEVRVVPRAEDRLGSSWPRALPQASATTGSGSVRVAPVDMAGAVARAASALRVAAAD